MLIDTLNECIVDMKTVHEMEMVSVDTKKQATADYNFKQLVWGLKKTVSEVDLAVKNSDFKENNTDTGRKHSQTYRSLKFNQAENREISSSDRFEKIEKQEKFIDDNFNVFKNSDENKSFSDETKNSSFMVVENAHSLKYEKASNKKFKDKV